MANCLSAKELEGYLHGDLPDGELARVESHVAECSSCREAMERGRSTADSDALWPERTVSAAGGKAKDAGVKLTFPAPEPGPIEGYELLNKIHEGGQGIVYKAVQKSTGRMVAVKLLRGGAYASERQRRRFEREIQLAANLKHPNIVTIYESRLTSSGDYCAMEYIHGLPLDEYVVKNDVDSVGVLRLMAKVAAAVNYAHRRGVIHRDLKPGNILVDAEGEPHVLDFGLAKAAGMEAAGDAPLTVTSEFMGTLAYASPEQTKGDPSLVDLRSDVYSLGVILYRALTGQFPYEISSDPAVMFEVIRKIEAKPPSVHRQELAGEVDTIVLRSLAKAPDRRYQTAGEFGQDIERVLSGDSILARRDSVVYRVRRQCGSFLVHHRMTAIVLVLLTSTLLAETLGSKLMIDWTGSDVWLRRMYFVNAALADRVEHFKNVRVVRLAKNTPVPDIANTEGLEGVDLRNVVSLRRLHGKLMEKLAVARPAVVAWDIKFRSETEFDGDFVKGVRALSDAGTDTVIAVPDWELDAKGRPELSPAIAPHVRWGSVGAYFQPIEPWHIPLLVQRGLERPRFSLVLTALAARLHAGADVRAIIQRDESKVDIVYERDDPLVSGATRIVGATEGIELYKTRQSSGKHDDFGIAKDDLEGLFTFSMPDDEALEEATIAYEEVFEATDAKLGEWFGGKTVLIGDCRSNGEQFDHQDGRTICGVYGHAVALESLLSLKSIRFAPYWQVWGATFIAALIAAVIAHYVRGRVAHLFISIVLTSIGLITASAVVFDAFQFFIHPGKPILAGTTAAVIITILTRRFRSEWNSQTQGEYNRASTSISVN